MGTDLTVIVGGSLAEDLAAFRTAWERTEQGEEVAAERVLAFESCEALRATADRLPGTIMAGSGPESANITRAGPVQTRHGRS